MLRDKKRSFKVAGNSNHIFYRYLFSDDFKGKKNIEQARGENPLSMSSLDEIGVLVVDGKFDLYGRILFGNKQILNLLGYSAE